MSNCHIVGNLMTRLIYLNTLGIYSKTSLSVTLRKLVHYYLYLISLGIYGKSPLCVFEVYHYPHLNLNTLGIYGKTPLCLREVYPSGSTLTLTKTRTLSPISKYFGCIW